MITYDAIVIGAGAGGGIAAALLAEAGKQVLLLERGRALSFADIGRDHLRNHRLAQYGHNTGPELSGNLRVFVDLVGRETIVRPNEAGYHNNAVAVGGSTRVYGAQAWRFLPQDFRMTSRYGVPSGSSLANWPIDYAELEPYYERAEWELGVAGDDGEQRDFWPRRRPYPLPPVPVSRKGAALRAGAATLGWRTSQP